jgi:hypothetical protein
MQLDMFSPVEPQPADEESYNVPLDFTDLEFGPLSKTEAQAGVSFLHMVPETQVDARDAFFSTMKRERIAAIIEQVAMENSTAVNMLDGRKSSVRPELVPLVLDRMNGATYQELGRKYGKTPGAIHHFFNRPAVRMMIARLLGEFASSLGDVDARIKAHATEAVETQVDIMRNGKEDNRLKASFNILRMAGYDQSATNKGGGGITINNNNNVQVNEDTIANTEKLLQALAESRQARTVGFEKHIDKRRLVNTEVAVVEAPTEPLALATGTNG